MKSLPPKFKVKNFRVAAHEGVKLKHVPTRGKPLYQSKEQYLQLLQAELNQLRELQNLLYASDRWSLLLIFQAMDAAGKDGVIEHVMSGVNPQGCQVFSFKHPSAEELDHDFLWRTMRALPERGRIGIFNRSYYEEVLIVRVHPEILAAQKLPQEEIGGDAFWQQRYESINEMERHLARNGTCVIKFFLHVSKEEQCRRFLARIDDPSKNWKFSAADVAEREHWDAYMEAYEDCITATSTKAAPWYIVPADDKPNARLAVATIIVETLRKLRMEYPRLDDQHQRELQTARAQLLAKGKKKTG